MNDITRTSNSLLLQRLRTWNLGEIGKDAAEEIERWRDNYQTLLDAHTELLNQRATAEPGTLQAPIDGPFEAWFRPKDGTRGVMDDRNGITLTVHGFVDDNEHRKYCEDLARTLNIRAGQPPSEVAWLIETKFSPALWLEVDPVKKTYRWTSDANKAVRFARKEDAEGVIELWSLQVATAAEHMWCSGPTSTKEVP